MAIALDVFATGAALNTFTTGTANTAAAPSTFIALAETGYNLNGPGALTDSPGNTYIALTQRGGAACSAQISYKASPATSATHSFTDTGSTLAAVLAGIGFTGVKATSPFDQENGTTVTSSITVLQTGTLTPSEDNCVVIAILTWASAAGSLVAIDSGFTIITQTAYSAGVNNGGAVAYKVQTTAGAVNPQWSWTSSTTAVAAIASFKAAAGGGGGRGLFRTPPLNGMGAGGSFFRDPLAAPMQMVKRDRIYVPAWLSEAA